MFLHFLFINDTNFSYPFHDFFCYPLSTIPRANSLSIHSTFSPKYISIRIYCHWSRSLRRQKYLPLVQWTIRVRQYHVNELFYYLFSAIPAGNIFTGCAFRVTLSKYYDYSRAMYPGDTNNRWINVDSFKCSEIDMTKNLQGSHVILYLEQFIPVPDKFWWIFQEKKTQDRLWLVSQLNWLENSRL